MMTRLGRRGSAASVKDRPAASTSDRNTWGSVFIGGGGYSKVQWCGQQMFQGLGEITLDNVRRKVLSKVWPGVAPRLREHRRQMSSATKKTLLSARLPGFTGRGDKYLGELAQDLRRALWKTQNRFNHAT